MTEKSATWETRSQVSCSSVRSRASSTGSAAAKARAKAEAAKARLAFVEQEADLKLKMAKLEVSIEILNVKKETAAAVAEAEALESATDLINLPNDQYNREIAPLEAINRTTEYVFNQGQQLDEEHQQVTLPSNAQQDTDATPMSLMPDAKPLIPNQDDRVAQPLRQNSQLPHDWQEHIQKKNAVRFEHDPLAPTQPAMPQVSRGVHPPPSSYSSPKVDDVSVNDFMRYLARRELVSTGLLRFNDKPQNYRAWKRSFESAIHGLCLTSSEEMDLLLKWLGKDSAEHVERIRAIHINRPDAGLAMIWNRLDQMYGAAEIIEDALFKRIETFPKITHQDYSKLIKLSDLLSELLAAKDEGDLPGLAFLDTARGINPVLRKLPCNLQEKWASVGSAYKQRYQVSYPPFGYFVYFISQEASIRNDPSFNLSTREESDPRDERAAWKSHRHKEVSTHKTEVISKMSPKMNELFSKPDDFNKMCLLHKKPHPLRKCRAFREKPIEDRKSFLKENHVCFKCCASTLHVARNCSAKIQCAECNSERHPTVLHPGPAPWAAEVDPPLEHGGESELSLQSQVNTQCTQVCGGDLSNRSCSKISLVKVYPSGLRNKAKRVYAILDDQSNRSLVTSHFFDVFSDSSLSSPYTLRTCSGVKQVSGRRATGYEVESLDGTVRLSLPSLIECNDIPNNRDEIPTPDVALHHPHLKSLAHLIPEVDPNAPIMLLLGRDILRVHKVRKQVNGTHNAPYAQKLDLGWVVVGNVCLGNVHKPPAVCTFFTATSELGRPSLFRRCPNVFHVKENYGGLSTSKHLPACLEEASMCEADHLGCSVFQRTKDDNQVAPSIQDAYFMKIMQKELRKDLNNSWIAPLPFKHPRPRLPNNRSQALKRVTSLKRNLDKKPEMREHFLSFMGRMLENNHAELAPPLSEEEERWYLPTFGVYHPRKPKQIRVVFDSSAQFNGISLNDVLLTGPDLNNALLGVLIRFREEAVAFTADIEQMFYCFLVKEEDRNFLRFLWYEDNDLSKNIVDYRMRVHVFGNRPSPAVAINGLHQSVQGGEFPVDHDVQHFVTHDFYVDDGLKSLPTNEAAISLLKRTQEVLLKSNLRLHKIAANSKEVMEAFPPSDRASDLKELNLDVDQLPMQRSLGLVWNLQTDCFHFSVSEEVRPYTRRGVLSMINSLYDPLGFAAPITIQGKAILRELTVGSIDWDAPLPKEREEVWLAWRASLTELSHLSIPRLYTKMSPSAADRKELCVFCDASTKAIAAVAYLKVTDSERNNQVGFVMGKAKLAPRPEHTIPRLELCAAVLAIELADLVSTELNFQLDAVSYYTDSKVVLGYIHNETRRFYVYVSNRVLRIRRSSNPNQWYFVPTDQNPADHATRFVAAGQLIHTNWLVGPKFLYLPEPTGLERSYNLIEPDIDSEVRPLVSTLSTTTPPDHLGSQRFVRFSSWKSLTCAMARLVHIAHLFHVKATENDSCRGWHYCKADVSVEERNQASTVIIKTVQEETYCQEIRCIQEQKKIPSNSPLKNLDPFVAIDGLLKVGGRLQHSNISQCEKTPVIIPGNHHIATLIIRHHHEQVHHQGRLFTEGAIRSAGFWIIGGKRKTSSVIHQCVICRRLRAPVSSQKMADLPAARLSTDPPFTHVGLDVFGPWIICSRRTRGGLAQSKRWAVIFTCMSVRAIHIEVVESLESSSFINAFRRFLSVRGPVKHIYSDRGTNFIGACKEMGIPSNIDSTSVKTYLSSKGCVWTFNPPHASHFGGTWERMIGVVRRILDSMFIQLKDKLTHEVLTTFMSEVTAIVNARPLVPVTTDPEDSFILTPAALLTQKVNIVPVPPGEFGVSDLYKHQWRQVQHLSNTFWDRWRKQFLPTLQSRRKWLVTHPNIQPGSIVLLKDTHMPRNEWPLGLVTQTFPSKDDKVRKVEVRVCRAGGPSVFLRPVTEIVLLLSPKN
ncbi:uncharacterized protein LOC143514793 [Brachyhypopomus gauderio]|uniref:uncharacterized protein LOC143514793 n=1 Tax=Brachyhypopomus gauderio TaxID=698409 RepID=UPI00404193EE